jgi:hypothetical protein
MATLPEVSINLPGVAPRVRTQDPGRRRHDRDGPRRLRPATRPGSPERGPVGQALRAFRPRWAFGGQANDRLRDVGHPRANILLLRAQGQKIGSQAVNHTAKFS